QRDRGRVPAVEVAEDRHPAGVGRPHAERHPVVVLAVRAELLVQTGVGPLVEQPEVVVGEHDGPYPFRLASSADRASVTRRSRPANSPWASSDASCSSCARWAMSRPCRKPENVGVSWVSSDAIVRCGGGTGSAPGHDGTSNTATYMPAVWWRSMAWRISSG